MPTLRCTECEEETFESSYLAIGTECQACDEGVLEEVNDDEYPEETAEPGPGSGPQLGLARAAARSVLERAAITSPPVPVEKLVEAHGLRVVERRGMGEISARLKGDLIELAPCGPARRRFLLAHELGHRVLAKPHRSGPHVEKEVNAFAGELLVPGPMLLVALKLETDSQSLARRFAVSKQVIEIAAANHNVAARLQRS